MTVAHRYRMLDTTYECLVTVGYIWSITYACDLTKRRMERSCGRPRQLRRCEDHRRIDHPVPTRHEIIRKRDHQPSVLSSSTHLVSLSKSLRSSPSRTARPNSLSPLSTSTASPYVSLFVYPSYVNMPRSSAQSSWLLLNAAASSSSWLFCSSDNWNGHGGSVSK